MKIDIFQTTTGWWVAMIDGKLFYGAGLTKQAVIDYLKEMKIEYKEG